MAMKKKRPADVAAPDRAGTRTTNSISHPVAGYKEDAMSNRLESTVAGRAFLAGKIAIRCETKHEYDQLMDMCEATKLRWGSGNPMHAERERNFRPGATYTLGDPNHRGSLMHCFPPCDCGRVGECGHRNSVGFSELSTWPSEALHAPGNPFQVGDIVRGISDRYAFTNAGMTRGEVVWARDDKIGVRMLEHRRCYCNNTVFPVESEHFALAERPGSSDRKIVITTDGRVTTARLIDGKQTVKTATATCSPNDAFDFNQGAGVAFGRLIVTPEWAEWYADKAKVLDDLSAWLKGAGK